MKKIKSVEVGYIESGTFVDCEEDVSIAGFESSDDLVVIKGKDFERLIETQWKYDDLCIILAASIFFVMPLLGPLIIFLSK